MESYILCFFALYKSKMSRYLNKIIKVSVKIDFIIDKQMI